MFRVGRCTALRPLYSLRGFSTVNAGEKEVRPKPLSAMPMVKGWPVIGTMLEFVKNYEVAHELLLQRHKDLGPIFLEDTGGFKQIYMIDPAALEKLRLQEGRYPLRIGFPAWDEYNKDAGRADGLLTAQGELWYRLRSVIDKPLMKFKTVESYGDQFSAVAADLLDRLAALRGPDGVVERIDVELFNWALESICTVLYEKRMGCLSDNRSATTTEFIEATHAMGETTNKLIFFPPKFSKMFRRKDWKRFTGSMDTVFRIAKENIDQKLQEIVDKPEDEDAGFIQQLMAKGVLSPKEMYANITHVMAGSVDTTTHTVQFLLYEVSRQPDIQGRLLEEVTRVVPPGVKPTSSHLRDMPYLKAVLKETLRLYPAGSVVMRNMPKDDVVMGYHVPAGTMVSVPIYALGRQASLYDDPLTFKPDRWMRDNLEERQKRNPYTYLSFGFGPRMCVGRRVAEMEIQTLVSHIIQRFEIEPADDKPIEVRAKLFLLPKDPVRIRFIDRK
ncbi:1,25-dihydroxyvitamin D(3) 24-hydroxylase, mitochondrial-like [Haliotis rufescens]|uniref:1,25-dihydroxyvitamin D(3) 24-hydroxylase, mitochondrial-like n=1 Tax=Haliotis rufescens TaxID=6454 RepID=UPI00201F072B|nr:1,25-dihydroxyvitamin D(3) 24-hydroxylase, mitochondrial-like [Haliotis rufescens]